MLRVVVHLLEQVAHVGGLGHLAAVALGEGQIVLQHVLHLVDVGLQGARLRLVAQECKLQLEARQHRAQVVADAGQHGRALVDVLGDALAHLDESLRRLAYLAGAARAEIVRHGRPLPNASAASASRRIGLIWLRMNRIATVSRTTEVPTIHIRKICELEA